MYLFCQTQAILNIFGELSPGEVIVHMIKDGASQMVVPGSSSPVVHVTVNMSPKDSGA